MPSSAWETTTLGTLAHVEMGQSPASELVSESEGSGVPFLQGNAEFSALHPTPRLWCRKPPKMCRRGDSLISVRAPVGAINRADQEYCIGRGLAAVRFTGANADFGYHALGYFSTALRRVAQGTTFEAVGGFDLRSLSVPRCDRAEQDRIAAILETLDDAIRRTEQVIGKLQQMKQGLLHDLLTRGVDENGDLRPSPSEAPHLYKDSPLGRIPRGWRVSIVGREFEVQLGKMLSTVAKTGRYSKPYLNNKAVQWERVDTRELQLMDFTPSEQAKFSLLPGDLLVCEGGEVGRTAMWQGELRDCYFQKAVHRLRPTRGYEPRLMLRYMRFAAICGRFTEFTSQTSIAHLTQEKLSILPLPLPPASEQRQLASMFDGLDQRLTLEVQGRGKLFTLKHGLLHDLLTGRVRVLLPAEAPE